MLPIETRHRHSHGLILYRFGAQARTCTGVLAQSAQGFCAQGSAASCGLEAHVAPSFHKRRWSRPSVSPRIFVTFVC